MPLTWGYTEQGIAMELTLLLLVSASLSSRRRRLSSSRIDSTSSTADTKEWRVARESADMAKLRRKYQSLEKAYKALEEENDTVKEQL